MVKNLPANAGDLSSIPGMGRSPGEGNGNPLQCSCLRKPMDRGAWQLQSTDSQKVGQDLVTKRQTIDPLYWDAVHRSDSGFNTYQLVGPRASDLTSLNLSFLCCRV